MKTLVEAMHNLRESNTELITITDGNNSTEIDFNSLDFGFGIGDYFYNGKETGAQIGFTWDEEKGDTYINNLFLNVYVKDDEEGEDIETINKYLKNKTPDKEYLVTLSTQDYQTFLNWKKLCDVDEFTYYSQEEVSKLEEDKKEVECEKPLNEERYYYGEIEHVKDMIKNGIMKDLLDTTNFIKENITSENPETNEYTSEQIDSLDGLNIYLETEYKNFEKVVNNLTKLFPSRIRAMTPEEKAELQRMKQNGEI